MRGTCTIAMPLALALALMTSLPAMVGTSEVCHATQLEVGNVAQCMRTVCKAAQAELASTESTRRTALRAHIAVNKSMDRGTAMTSDRTVRAHRLYRQVECDLSRRLARNTPSADLAEVACEADLSRERIDALRDATQPAIPTAAPAAPS